MAPNRVESVEISHAPKSLLHSVMLAAAEELILLGGGGWLGYLKKRLTQSAPQSWSYLLYICTR